MKGKTFYYTDPVNDDFAGTNIAGKRLQEGYRYLPKSRGRRAVAWVLHHIVATPLVYLFLKISCGQKIVGRSKLRPYRKEGYFLYGNHTRTAGDAFTPSIAAFPKKPYIVVNADAVSIPFLRRVVEDLGAMPVPDSWETHKSFLSAIETRAERGNVIVIYPEAHIWPLYTGIRPFPDSSFAYPVSAGKPVFTFTTTYAKRKLFGGVKATVYIDGPFFAEEGATKKQQKKDLRDRVYAAMEARSELSTYSPNRFIQREATAEIFEQTEPIEAAVFERGERMVGGAEHSEHSEFIELSELSEPSASDMVWG